MLSQIFLTIMKNHRKNATWMLMVKEEVTNYKKIDLKISCCYLSMNFIFQDTFADTVRNIN